MNFGQACFVDFSLSPAHIYGAICIVIVIDISDFYLHHSFTRVHFLHVCFLPLSVSSCDQAFSTSNCRAFIYWCLRLFSACFSACRTDHTCHGFCTCITCLLICRVSIYINIYLYQHLSISTFIYITKMGSAAYLQMFRLSIFTFYQVNGDPRFSMKRTHLDNK